MHIILLRKHLLKRVLHALAYRAAQAVGGLAGRKSDIKEGDMGHTYNNTFTNSGGEQNIAQGDGAIGKQVNITGTQAPVEDLLKIIAALKNELPGLPDEVRAEMEHEVAGAEIQACKPKPDRKKIAATLIRAQDVLKAVPGTVAAALPVGKLLGRDALIWCGKMAGM